MSDAPAPNMPGAEPANPPPTGAAAMTGETPQPEQQPAQPQQPPAERQAEQPQQPAQPQQPTQTWVESIQDEELRGLAEAKGWDSPEKALRSYRELERFKGVPPEQLIRVPMDTADTDAMDEVFGKLGRPEDPDKYTLNGEPYEEDSKWAREIFHKARLTNDQAAEVMQGWNEQLDSFQQEQQEEFNRQASADIQELRKEWGRAFDANVEAGKRILGKLGLSREQAESIEQAVGTRTFMEMFSQMGSWTGEAQAPEGGGGNQGFNVMSREAARAKREALLGDPDFQRRFLSEDQRVREKAKNELHQLSQLGYDE